VMFSPCPLSIKPITSMVSPGIFHSPVASLDDMVRNMGGDYARDPSHESNLQVSISEVNL